ncbi:MAG: lipoyl(octanoyl) transferase LipB [Crocosphaera sp.]|nr:lipoyl(octanoyl) transferase LipB [Crocosphaera sp.]
MSNETVSQPRKCILRSLGMIPYEVAWEMQRSLVKERMEDPGLDDTLLLLEHPAVYTLGTGADDKFIKFNPKTIPIKVYRVERGGEVTYHCPGQLVGYPILNLRYYQQDLHWYLRQLEEVILQVLNHYQLSGERIPGLTGVWVEGYKVAAIGIKVKRWITMHGFSLNVCPDLKGFNRIIPCGIEDKPVGSLRQFLPEITLEQIQPQVIQAFAQVFEIDII